MKIPVMDRELLIKGKVQIVIVATLFACGLVVLGSTVTANQIDFSELKSYSNTEYGFSLNYPNDYIVFREGKESVQFVNKKYKNVEGEVPSILIKIRDNPEEISIDNWHKENPALYIGDRKFSDVKEVSFSNLQFADKETSSLLFRGMGELQSTVIKHADHILLDVIVHSLTDLEFDEDLTAAYNIVITSLKTTHE